MNRKLWIILAFADVVGIFLLQNTQVVEVRFLFWKLQMSRSVLLLGVLGAGGVIGWVMSRMRRR